MSTLNSLWTGVTLMVQSNDGYKVLVKTKLDNGWYEGKLLTSCSIGYVEATDLLLAGDQAVWSSF